MIDIIAQITDVNVTEALLSTVEQVTELTETAQEQALERLKATGITGSIQGGLGCLGAAIGVGIVGMKGAEAVGRNPDAAVPILVQSIIGMALAEAVAFYSLFL
jgi:F-type H+-transporting ATPase subunit c